MIMSPQGVKLIKQHEGLRLKAYLCPAGVPTIGYGHTKGVKLGMSITEATAEALLQEDLAWVYTCIKKNVKVKLNQNQFDALCSFIFNIGAGAFQKSSTLARLNAGSYRDAADAMLKWCKAKQKGKLVVMPGLVKRREDERRLFLKPTANVPEIKVPAMPQAVAGGELKPLAQSKEMIAGATAAFAPLGAILSGHQTFLTLAIGIAIGAGIFIIGNRLIARHYGER